jgi:serine/threonine protein kinase
MRGYTGVSVKQIGRFQIEQELGRGAMGIVYKALDPAIGRTVAIKAIRLTNFVEGLERQRVREQLLREAQSAGLLSHPNIVTIYDVLEEGEYAYIFMEYVQGSSLEKMLHGHSLPEGPALLDFLRQVSDALDYAHRKGIIHRDIKPGNIIVSEGGTKIERSAKITDFGIAKFISQEMTQGGTMVGTPSYMSPEQIQGTTVDARSDQFSLAVVVYEILSGARPFIAENVPALLYVICKQDPQPIQQVNSSLNEGVGKVLQRALSKNAEERFASCGDFIETLATALEGSPAWKTTGVGAFAKERHVLDETTGERSVPLIAAAGRPRSHIVSPTPTDGLESGVSRQLPYELPVLPRRRRDQENDDLDEMPQRSSVGTKLGLVLAVCLLIAGAVVFFKRWMPSPNVPVQVLDTNSSPTTPAPADANAAKREAVPPEAERSKQEQGNTEAAPKPTVKQNQENAQTAPTQPPEEKQDTQAARSEPTNQRRRANRKAPVNSARANRQTVPEESAGPTVADVELLTEPPGAKIVVDNRLRDACTSPCSLSLQNGRHTMLAQMSGYTDARRIFTVPEDDSVFVTLAKSMGVLIVTSSPPGASIFVDGKNYGHTPSTLHLPAGMHVLALVNGPLRHEETIDIQNDGLAERNFRFSEQ